MRPESAIRGQNDLPSVDSITDPQLWPIAVARPLQADRSTSLLVRSCDRLTLTESAIETDGETLRFVISNRILYPYYAIDIGGYHLSMFFTVASIEHNQLDACTYSAECEPECCGRNELSMPISSLKAHAIVSGEFEGTAFVGGIATQPRVTHRRPSSMSLVVTTEMDHGGPELT